MTGMIDKGYNDKKEPLVSVIVPIYNVEKYLRRCIDSILLQTYQNYEILLVDDGSPDNCGTICDEYARKNEKIIVIHQDNQGVSAARNNAVPISKGEYITFIDPDDYVTSDYISYLYSLIDQYSAEISVGSKVYQYEGKNPKAPREETKVEFYNVEEALAKMNCSTGFGTFAWGKLYKRELVEAYPFPVGRRYEDLATTYKLVGSSTGVVYGNKQIYYWQQRADSFMHKEFNIRQLDGIEAAKNQLEYIQKYYPSALSAAKYRYTAKAVELTDILFFSGGDRNIFKELKTYVNEYANSVLKDANTKTSIKIRIRAMKFGYCPAKLVFFLHNKIKKIML